MFFVVLQIEHSLCVMSFLFFDSRSRQEEQRISCFGIGDEQSMQIPSTTLLGNFLLFDFAEQLLEQNFGFSVESPQYKQFIKDSFEKMFMF